MPCRLAGAVAGYYMLAFFHAQGICIPVSNGHTMGTIIATLMPPSTQDGRLTFEYIIRSQATITVHDAI
mgnify:CR=1 FL=1